MDAVTRLQVRQRAGSRCEYCQIPEAATPFIAFHTEHIIAQQHLVDDSLDNLAWHATDAMLIKAQTYQALRPTRIPSSIYSILVETIGMNISS